MTQHSAPASTPALLVLDVNETLSDLAPLAARFEEVPLPGHLAPAWFAGVLRDGFALGMTESSAPFALIGQELLRATLADAQPTRDIDDAIGHVMSGFMSLDVPGHFLAPDVQVATFTELADLLAR